MTPVTLLDFEGDSYVQATYGAPGWGRNLRAVGEATVICPGGRRSPVQAIEVPPGEAATLLRRARALPPGAPAAQIARPR